MNRKVYDNIVKASGIEAGNMVIIQYWMNEEISEDVAYLQAAIASVGATPVLLLQSRHMNQLIFEQAKESCFDEKYFQIYEKADVVIDLMERPIAVLESMLEDTQMQLVGGYMQKMFQYASTRKKMLQLRVPTEQNAKAENLPFAEYQTRMEQAMNIDYDQLLLTCKEKVKEVEHTKQVTIQTGEQKEFQLSLHYEGRNWLVDAGDGDLPCGEIYISPIENQAQGQIYFESIYLPDIENPRQKCKYENVVCTVENGRIIKANRKEVQSFIDENPPEQLTICELGIGLNEHVTSLCGCALLDEKMIDTFHIGIGDNTMFGGSNEADDHMDLIGKGNLIFV